MNVNRLWLLYYFLQVTSMNETVEEYFEVVFNRSFFSVVLCIGACSAQRNCVAVDVAQNGKHDSIYIRLVISIQILKGHSCVRSGRNKKKLVPRNEFFLLRVKGFSRNEVRLKKDSEEFRNMNCMCINPFTKFLETHSLSIHFLCKQEHYKESQCAYQTIRTT